MAVIDDVVKAIRSAKDIEERQREILQPLVDHGWKAASENFVIKNLKDGVWVGVSEGDLLAIRVFPGGVSHEVATVDETLRSSRSWSGGSVPGGNATAFPAVSPSWNATWQKRKPPSLPSTIVCGRPKGTFAR